MSKEFKNYRVMRDSWSPHTINSNLLRTFKPHQYIFLSVLINKYSQEWWMADSDESNLYYSKEHKKELAQGWFNIEDEELINDYSLSLKMISACKTYFKKLGILKTLKSGIPPKNYYLIRADVLKKYIDEQDREKDQEDANN